MRWAPRFQELMTPSSDLPTMASSELSTIAASRACASARAASSAPFAAPAAPAAPAPGPRPAAWGAPCPLAELGLVLSMSVGWAVAASSRSVACAELDGRKSTPVRSLTLRAACPHDSVILGRQSMRNRPVDVLARRAPARFHRAVRYDPAQRAQL